MSKQNLLPTEQTGQLTRPLIEQEKLDSALLRMAIRLDKVLTERVINQWHEDLEGWAIEAIEYAANRCGEDLTRWPKWKEFKDYLQAWTGKREEEAGQYKPLGRAEIDRRRKEFHDWYGSDEAKEVRAMVQAIDKKINAGRPRLYTKEELERFKKR